MARCVSAAGVIGRQCTHAEEATRKKRNNNKRDIDERRGGGRKEKGMCVVRWVDELRVCVVCVFVCVCCLHCDWRSPLFPSTPSLRCVFGWSSRVPQRLVRRPTNQPTIHHKQSDEQQQQHNTRTKRTQQQERSIGDRRRRGELCWLFARPSKSLTHFHKNSKP